MEALPPLRSAGRVGIATVTIRLGDEPARRRPRSRFDIRPFDRFPGALNFSRKSTGASRTLIGVGPSYSFQRFVQSSPTGRRGKCWNVRTLAGCRRPGVWAALSAQFDAGIDKKTRGFHWTCHRETSRMALELSAPKDVPGRRRLKVTAVPAPVRGRADFLELALGG